MATIALPSDPNQLIDMLTLRMESYYTGNNGVRNETVSIAGVLKQSDVVNDEQQGFNDAADDSLIKKYNVNINCR